MLRRNCLTALASVGFISILGATFPGNTAAAAPISPFILNPATGHSYALLSQSNWDTANTQATAARGYLSTVNDAAENAWLLSTFGTYAGQQHLLWIGLNDLQTEGTFSWVNGDPSAYRNFVPGEPNGGTGENYVALYYPNHSSAGKWNDWGSRSSDPIGIAFNGVVEIDHPVGPTFSFTTDATVRVIAPVGNTEGQPINNVGLTWEAANLGWNSNLAYNDAAWIDAIVYGNSIWGTNANTPLYGRMIVELTDTPLYAILSGGIDDDALIYINGVLVYADVNGSATDIPEFDVAQYLHAGTNLIAFKAHDSFGGSQSIRLGLTGVYVPEPSSSLIAVGSAMISLSRRKNRQG